MADETRQQHSDQPEKTTADTANAPGQTGVTDPVADPNAEAREQAKRDAIADAEQEATRLAGRAGEPRPASVSDNPGTSGETGEAPLGVAELEAQVSDLTDRLLRAHAEIQNLHRRLERDVADSQKYGITKFARDIVTMTDNFERALSSVSAEAAAESQALAGLLDGVRMIEKEFQTVLSKHHVKRLNPANELFDPHKHQAVMEKDDASVPAGTVIQVFQAGYEIDDRVLRPAMVVVAKGGAKPVKPVASEPPSDDQAAKTQTDPSEAGGDTKPDNSNDGAAA
ncbi:MAG: nucleotide exchange factor GrpE [Pseudomonadota bacterium]